MRSSSAIRPAVRAWAGLAAALSGACATVAPGRAAVVTWPNAGVDPAPLRDGEFWVGPFAQVELFDLRQQERDANFVATLSDGTRVQTGASLVTFRIAPDDLSAAARSIDADPYPSLIAPLLQSTVRRVLGRLSLAQLDTPHLRDAQAEITRVARERLAPLHILLDQLDLRQVAPVSRQLNDAITATSVLEQEVLRQPSELRLARQRADELRLQAAGLVAAHAALAPTLDEHALEDLRARAWSRLLAAPDTNVIALDRAQGGLEVSP